MVRILHTPEIGERASHSNSCEGRCERSGPHQSPRPGSDPEGEPFKPRVPFDPKASKARASIGIPTHMWDSAKTTLAIPRRQFGGTAACDAGGRGVDLAEHSGGSELHNVRFDSGLDSVIFQRFRQACVRFCSTSTSSRRRSGTSGAHSMDLPPRPSAREPNLELPPAEAQKRPGKGPRGTSSPEGGSAEYEARRQRRRHNCVSSARSSPATTWYGAAAPGGATPGVGSVGGRRRWGRVCLRGRRSAGQVGGGGAQTWAGNPKGDAKPEEGEHTRPQS